MRKILTKKKSVNELLPELMELTQKADQTYSKYASDASITEIQQAIRNLAMEGNKLAKQNEKLMETSEMKLLLENIEKLTLLRDKLTFESSFSILAEETQQLLNEAGRERENVQDYVVALDQTSIELKKLFQYPKSVYKSKRDEILTLIKKLDRLSVKLLS